MRASGRADEPGHPNRKSFAAHASAALDFALKCAACGQLEDGAPFAPTIGCYECPMECICCGRDVFWPRQRDVAAGRAPPTQLGRPTLKDLTKYDNFRIERNGREKQLVDSDTNERSYGLDHTKCIFRNWAQFDGREEELVAKAVSTLVSAVTLSSGESSL